MTGLRLAFETPYGCRWCGTQHRHHDLRPAVTAGMHTWEQPDNTQVLTRMLQRRADHITALPAAYHATTGWDPDPDGESADPYCADCKTTWCPRWTRIQTRLDQQRWGLPRHTRRHKATADLPF